MGKQGREFELYKGLQKPLVFKSFKGKFIYWGVGSILFGLVSFMIIAPILSLWPALIAASIILGGGLGYTAINQKKGLHSKTRSKGIFIVPALYKPKKNVKENI